MADWHRGGALATHDGVEWFAPRLGASRFQGTVEGSGLYPPPPLQGRSVPPYGTGR